MPCYYYSFIIITTLWHYCFRPLYVTNLHSHWKQILYYNWFMLWILSISVCYHSGRKKFSPGQQCLRVSLRALLISHKCWRLIQMTGSFLGLLFCCNMWMNSFVLFLRFPHRKTVSTIKAFSLKETLGHQREAVVCPDPVSISQASEQGLRLDQGRFYGALRANWETILV